MQCPAFAGQDAFVDGLAGERVAKGKLLCRLLDHQLGGNQLLQEIQQVPLLQSADLPQQREIEAPTRDRSQA
jgi:hypothetical protein